MACSNGSANQAAILVKQVSSGNESRWETHLNGLPMLLLLPNTCCFLSRLPAEPYLRKWLPDFL